MAPSYRLHYFNFRARAEPIRILFHLADVEYEDIRIEPEEWPALKPTTPWWQVPILEVDGKVLAQTCAIYQYLAKKFGYNGKNDWESAKIAEIICVIDDIFHSLKSFFVAEGVDAKREALTKSANEILIPYLKRLEETLEKNGTGFFVGDSMTIADLTVSMAFEFLKVIEAPGVENTLVENGFPKLDELAERINTVPKIKEWIEKRPKTKF